VPSTLSRKTCAEVAIDPAAILDLIDALEHPEIDMHSLMVLRHGAVAAEAWWKPYRAESPHLLYSLTKSFTSTAAGFAVSEGFFALDDLVSDHFQEQMPSEPNEFLGKMQVRHLLTMSVGHQTEPFLDVRNADWRTAATKFLAHPVVFEPGSHFLYNTAATNMVSILVQKTSGLTLDRYLEPRLLAPLGIENEYWSSGAD
jgi:CubicO group peptidase (beta-lactamase class C family)